MRTVLPLIFVILFAVTLRVIHFQAIKDSAFIKFPLQFSSSDMHATLSWAQEIAAGDWLGRQTYHPYVDWMKQLAPLETWYRWWGGKEIFQQEPFYPYWVALIVKLFGPDLVSITLIQLVLGSFEAIVVFLLAKHFFDRRVGMIAACIAAMYGPLLFYQGTLLRDWLPPLLEPLVLVSFLKARERRRASLWLLSGVYLGFSALCKSTVLLFTPFLALWLLVSRKEKIENLTAILMVGIGAGLALSPLLLRNIAVGAPCFSICNRFPEAFIFGNAADGNPVGLLVPASTKSILEGAQGSLVKVIGLTLSAYEGHWFQFSLLQLHKVRALVDPLEPANNLSFYYGKTLSPLLSILPGYGVVFPLAVLGMVLSFKNRRPDWLMLLYSASTLLSLLGTIITDRYRLLLVPVISAYAGFTLLHVYTLLNRRYLRLLVTLSLLAAVIVIQQVVVPIKATRRNPFLVLFQPGFSQSAALYAKENRFEMAAAEMRKLRNRASELEFPEIADSAGLKEAEYLGMTAQRLIEQKKMREAAELTAQAEKAYGQHALEKGPAFNLGNLYFDMGRYKEASSYFDEFLKTAPNDPRAEFVRQRRRAIPAGVR